MKKPQRLYAVVCPDGRVRGYNNGVYSSAAAPVYVTKQAAEADAEAVNGWYGWCCDACRPTAHGSKHTVVAIEVPPVTARKERAQ